MKPMTLEDLESDLTRAGIDYSKWPTSSGKSTLDLLSEILVGESTLVVRGEGIIRHCTVVLAQVFTPEKAFILTETRRYNPVTKELKEVNNAYIGGKLKHNEIPYQGMARELNEELFAGNQKLSDTGIKYVKFEGLTSDSPSYPGLTTSRLVLSFEWEMPVELVNIGGYTEKSPSGREIKFEWRMVD